jgi:hypothetical protein
MANETAVFDPHKLATTIFMLVGVGAVAFVAAVFIFVM